MNSIKLIKNRSDIGAGTRGADMGIDAIEIAAINKGNDYFTRFEFFDVEPENHSVYDKSTNLFAKRIEHVLTVCDRVCDAVSVSLSANKFPLVLSGDHSSALGSISGMKKAFPDKRIGVVWIDAHADIHSPHTSPSGNIHGMPLAAALSEDNLERKINDLKTETDAAWTGLKNLGIKGAKIKHEDIIYFGVRDTEEPEDFIMEKYGIKNYKVEEVRYRGMDVCMNEAIEKMNGCDLIYVSFDVDSMDCDLISMGTGTPVSKGFDQYEVMEIIKRFIQTGKVGCFEVVEVNPTLDTKGNVMAETAFQVLDETTKHILAVNIK